jgi:hypothetical protein
MKHFLNVSFALLFVLLACSPVLAQYIAPVDSTINAGNISTDVVLDKNKKYLLNGVVKVNDGASLTIPAGTLIFGSPNQIIGGVPVIGGTLVIQRGGKIFANGTAQEPIVFTSSRPVGQRAAGDWGGIVILGRATNNQGLNVGIEGLTGEFHGGTDDNDNSGVMRYVRIEFAGFELSPNNEVNTLTMGSVGKGTIIEYIQASYGLDDSFEWFGGNVDGKYLIAYKTKDDCFDTDFGYTGKVQFALSWRDPQIADQSRSEAFESDNDGSGSLNTPRTAPIFSNVTAIGPKRSVSDVAGVNFDNNFYYGVHQRRSTQQSIFNSVFTGYNQGGILLDGTNVMTDMQNAVSKFRYNFVDGQARGNTSGTLPGGFVFNTWFDEYNVNYPTTLNQVNFKAPFNQHAPGLNPLPGSPLLGAANFTDPLLNDPFFTPVTYVGAFPQDGSNNWDRGWANYDPQNTLYGLETSSPDWVASINLQNTNNEVRQVVIGRHPSATDGLDNTLGEANLPPLPPPAVIDLRLELPGATQFSVLDLRATGTVTAPIVYKVNFQPGTANGKLSWDPNLLGPGTWTMKVGTLVSINMKTTTQADILSDLAGASSVTIEVEPRFTSAFSVAANWNLVAFPGLRSDMTPTGLFPDRDPAAQVFKFTGSYQPVTELVPGEGYWLKMLTNKAYTYTNTEAVPREPYKGISGWNIIGSYEYVVDVNFIRTAPAGRKVGQMFRYVPGIGYQASSIMEDGFGYWINLSGAADILIPGSFEPTLSKYEENLISSQWGKINITDAAGQNYTLYAADASADLDMFNLPPLPPDGMFDIRFGSQRYVEIISTNQTIDLNGVVYPVTISVDGVNLNVEDAINGSFINSSVKSGENIVINNSFINKLKISSSNITPTEYVLEQNYPNPFNPATTIKFAIPETGNVRLVIYNSLGQQVAELVNSTLEAGNYSYSWDASTVASGMYFYELNTNNFTSVKKMMLLK